MRILEIPWRKDINKWSKYRRVNFLASLIIIGILALRELFMKAYLSENTHKINQL